MKRYVLCNIVDFEQFKSYFEYNKPMSLYGSELQSEDTSIYLVIENKQVAAAELFLYNNKIKYYVDKAYELTTLQKVADYINSISNGINFHYFSDFDVEEAINRNGWIDETNDEYGVCSDENQRVKFNTTGKAIVIDK